MNKLIILLVLLLIIPLVSADNLDISEVKVWVKQFDSTDLKIPCETSGGALCSASATCNVTVLISSNHTIYINNRILTNQGTYFNYSFNSSLMGRFTHFIYCKDGDLNGTSKFDSETNLDGIAPSQERTGALSRSIWIFFTLALFFLIIGSVLNTKFIFKFTLWAFGTIFLLMTINNVGVTLKGEIINPKITGVFDIVTTISFYAYMAIGFAVFVMWIFSVVLSIQDIQAKKKKEKYDY